MYEIEVFEKKKIVASCDNCLYKGCDGLHCGHADNKGAPMIFINRGYACRYYWLDQNRFKGVKY